LKDDRGVGKRQGEPTARGPSAVSGMSGGQLSVPNQTSSEPLLPPADETSSSANRNSQSTSQESASNSRSAASGPGSAPSTPASQMNAISRKMVYIPFNLVPLLIGAGGSTIQELQDKSGTRIQVDSDSSSTSTRQVEIVGTTDCIARAVDMLVYRLCLSEAQISGLAIDSSTPARDRDRDTQKVGVVTRLEKDFDLTRTGGADITDSDVGVAGGWKNNSIVEPAGNGARGRPVSWRRVTDAASDVDTVSDELEIPHTKVALVIGKRGTVVREIKRRTNCSIVIDNTVVEDSTSKTVSYQKMYFHGTKEQVDTAMSYVRSVIRLGAMETLDMTSEELLAANPVSSGSRTMTFRQITLTGGAGDSVLKT